MRAAMWGLGLALPSNLPQNLLINIHQDDDDATYYQWVYVNDDLRKDIETMMLLTFHWSKHMRLEKLDNIW